MGASYQQEVAPISKGVTPVYWRAELISEMGGTYNREGGT